MKIVYLIIFIFIGCSSSNNVFIQDASKDTIIKIETKSANPTTLHLKVIGQVNDTFILNNISIPGGIVDTVIKYDWYNKNFNIKYQSYKANTGSLSIEYKL